jgi:hypothetical protein
MGRSRARSVEKEGRLQTQLKKYIDLTETFAANVNEVEQMATPVQSLLKYCIQLFDISISNRSVVDSLANQ